MELQSSDMKMLEESLESSVESGTSVESMFECLKKRLFASFTMEESTIKQEELKILKEKDRNIRNGVESSIESSQLDKSEYNNNTMTDSCQWQGQMDAVNFSFEVEQSTMNSEEDVSPNTSKIGSPNAQSTQKECSQNVSGKTRHSVRKRKGTSNITISENSINLNTNDSSGNDNEENSSNSDVQLMKEYYSLDSSIQTPENKLQHLKSNISGKKSIIKALGEKLDALLHMKKNVDRAVIINPREKEKVDVNENPSEKEMDTFNENQSEKKKDTLNENPSEKKKDTLNENPSEKKKDTLNENQSEKEKDTLNENPSEKKKDNLNENQSEKAMDTLNENPREKEKDIESGNRLGSDSGREICVVSPMEIERDPAVEPVSVFENKDEPSQETDLSVLESSLNVSKLVAKIKEYIDDCNKKSTKPTCDSGESSKNKLTKPTCDSGKRSKDKLAKPTCDSGESSKDKENDDVINIYNESSTSESASQSDNPKNVNEKSIQCKKDLTDKACSSVTVNDLCDKNLKLKRRSIKRTTAEIVDVHLKNKAKKQNKRKGVHTERKEINDDRIGAKRERIVINNENNERNDANEEEKETQNVNSQTEKRNDMNKGENNKTKMKKKGKDLIKSKKVNNTAHKLSECENTEQNDEVCKKKQSKTSSQRTDEGNISEDHSKVDIVKSNQPDNSGSSITILLSPLSSQRNKSHYLGFEIGTLPKQSEEKNLTENNDDVEVTCNVSSGELNSTNSSLDIVPPSPVIATQAFHFAVEQTQPFVPDLSGTLMNVSHSSYNELFDKSKDMEVCNEEINDKSEVNKDNTEKLAVKDKVKEKVVLNATANDNSDNHVDAETSKDMKTPVKETGNTFELNDVDVSNVDESLGEKNDNESKMEAEVDDNETQAPFTKLIDKSEVNEGVDLEENDNLKAVTNDSLTSSESVVFIEPYLEETQTSRKEKLGLKTKNVNKVSVSSPKTKNVDNPSVKSPNDSGVQKSMASASNDGVLSIKPGGIKRKLSLRSSSINSSEMKRTKYSDSKEKSKEGSNKVNEFQNETNSAIHVKCETNNVSNSVRRKIILDESDSDELNNDFMGTSAEIGSKGQKKAASTRITRSVTKIGPGQLMHGEVNGTFRFYRSQLKDPDKKNEQSKNKIESMKKKIDHVCKDTYTKLVKDSVSKEVKTKVGKGSKERNTTKVDIDSVGKEVKTKVDKVPYVNEWLMKHDDIDKPKLPEGSQEWASHENQLDQTTTRVKDKQNAENLQDKITTRVKDKQNAENLQDKITTRVKDKQSTRQKNSTAWIQPDFTTEDSSNTPEVKLHDTSAGSPLKSPDTMNLKNLEVRLERIDDVYTFHSTASLNNKPKDKKGDKTTKKFTFTKINKDNEKDTVRNDRNGIRNSDTGNHRVKEAWESMPSAALYLRNFQNL